MYAQASVGIDLFELGEPLDLFKEIQAAAAEYERAPSSRLLLFLLFALNHLREWIANAGFEVLESKRQSRGLEPNELLFYELWTMEEFRLINSLCNRSKHHVTRGGSKTSVTQGMTCNSPCTDSLGQTYYRIDGVDSRAVFAPVIRKYWEWFHPAG
ncbi:hypothetical protein [Ramlibacter humi]|uniref:Uncharacterized protein n=1 Tax=Ramlibacter humi TaxID=2530451 RepID=A0A4Z0BK89_9BURK|nr:hypothetical protein [Ramlibacter humi]TFY98843.1 hypothetical protein EZ216_14815 [Ramlibacter humi]